MTQNFSDILVALRTGAGLSQMELGVKLNISNRAISKWENGVSQS